MTTITAADAAKAAEIRSAYAATVAAQHAPEFAGTCPECGNQHNAAIIKAFGVCLACKRAAQGV